MIQTDKLTKHFGEVRAVDEVSLAIEHGECVGLLGLNGAGKTTLLRMLACLLTPTSGSASIGGRPVNTASRDVRRQIGFLPEVPPLYGEMTVEQLLTFTARLRSVPAAQARDRVREVAARCQLDEVLAQRIETLSFGFRKRVGIAQAIVHRPPLVILDEPIAGLDPAQIAQMRELIRALHGEHTVVLSSHILAEISQTCDRILVMHRGGIVAQGSEEKLLSELSIDQRLRCTVRGDRAAIELVVGEVDGVEERTLEEAGAGLWTLRLSASRDVREELARALVGAGLGLRELAPAVGELESAFLRLTGQGRELR